jgi:hypothetical protein
MDAPKILIALLAGVLAVGLWQCYGPFLLSVTHAG